MVGCLGCEQVHPSVRKPEDGTGHADGFLEQRGHHIAGR